jgi:hypothetical protein
MDFDLEYKLEMFRKEQHELFDENGNRYTGVPLSNRTAEMMLELINELENSLINEEIIDMAFSFIKRFSEWDNKYPKGRIYSINSKEGMEMVRELDKLADESKEINKHFKSSFN